MDHTIFREHLSCGAPVYFVHAPGERNVVISFFVNSGYQFMPKMKYETPHLLEHCLFEKNKHFATSLDMMYAIETLGVYNNGSSSLYHNNYYMKGVSERSEEILDLLLKLVHDADLEEDEFLRQKEVIRNELLRSKNNFRTELNTKLYRTIKEEVQTYEERLGHLDSNLFSDIVHTYERYYTPRNMTYIFAGDVAEKRSVFLDRLESFYREREKGERAPLDLTIRCPEGTRTSHIDVKDRSDVEFVFDALIPMREKRENDLFNFFMSTLMAGSGSRIQHKGRREGFFYTLANNSFSEKDYLNFSVSERVAKEKIIPLLTLLFDEIEDMRKGNISEQELERARGYTYGGFLRSYETAQDIARYYMSEFIYGTERTEISEYAANILKYSVEDLADYAKSIDLSRWQLGIIGNGSDLITQEIAGFLESRLSR